MSSVHSAVVKNSNGQSLLQVLPSPLPYLSGSAVVSTLSTLYGAEKSSTAQLSQTGVIGLLPPLLSANTLNVEAQGYLTALTLSANAAANALACGSVLAGQTSETDEFGDLALWLGEGHYGKGHEREVLEALGLHGALGPQIKITPVEIPAAVYLPSNLAELVARSSEGKRLSSLLSQLDHIYSFTVQPMPAGGGSVAQFLLGHRSHEGFSGWAGLVGIGVWS
ncbi:hypothetical protein BKA93DRAFT_815531 [Sparassis latifolia]